MTKAEAIATLPQSSNAASEAIAYLIGAAVIAALAWVCFVRLVLWIDGLSLRKRIKSNLPLH